MATPSPSTSPRTRTDLRALAYALRDGIRAGSAPDIARARAVFHDLRTLPDADVAGRMGTRRCEHVIATEHGHATWAQVPASDDPAEIQPLRWIWQSHTGPHLTIVSRDAGTRIQLLQQVLDLSRRQDGPSREICLQLRYSATAHPPQPAVAPPSLRIPTHVNPCAGTLRDLPFIAALITHLIAQPDGGLSASTRGILEDAIEQAFTKRMQTVTYRTMDDIHQHLITPSDPARNRWLHTSAKWLLVAHTGSTPQHHGHLVFTLHDADGRPFDTPEAARNAITEDDMAWLRARQIHLVDGHRLQRDLGGAVLIANEALQRLPAPFPPTMARMVRKLDGVRAINTPTPDDLQQARVDMPDIQVLPTANGQMDPAAVFASVPGEAIIQDEVILSDIVDQLRGTAGNVQQLGTGTLGAQTLVSRLAEFVGNGSQSWIFDWRGSDIRHVTAGAPGETTYVDMQEHAQDGLTETMRTTVIGGLLHRILLDQQHARPVDGSGRIILILDGLMLQPSDLLLEPIVHLLRVGRMQGIAVISLVEHIGDVPHTVIRFPQAVFGPDQWPALRQRSAIPDVPDTLHEPTADQVICSGDNGWEIRQRDDICTLVAKAT